MKNFSLGIGLLSCMLLVGCMPDSLTKYHIEPTKPEAAASETESSGTVPAVNLSSLTAFQVKNITANSTTYHMHKYGQSFAATDCEIATSSLADGETALTNADGIADTGTNDIVCWLEAEELQLYHNGFDLQINVPANVCEYIRVSPFYFWKWRPANTQKVLKEVVCSDPAYCAPGGPVALSEADKACVGDYSGLTPIAGPNCDEGTVTVTTTTYTSPSSITTSEPVVTECGGKRTACYAGPGVDFKTNSDGYPESLDYFTYDGESFTYSAKKMSGNFYGNRYLTNFTSLFAIGLYTYDYTTVGSITGMEAFSDNSSTYTQTYTNLGLTTEYDDLTDTIGAGSLAAIDYARDPLKRADTASGGLYGVQPFYEFTCLNWADEVKGRIRVQVREWNQKFTTTTLAGDQVNRSIGAGRLKKHSATSTDYETSGIRYWNDYADWDTVTRYGSQSAYTPTSQAIDGYGFSFPQTGL